MKKISGNIIVATPRVNVLAVMLRIKEYPEFVPSIENLEVLEYADDKMEFVTRMTSNSKILPMPQVTVQRVSYDVDNMQVNIQQLEGRLKNMRSMRRIEAAGDHARIYAEVEYELPPGIIGSMMKPIAQASVEQNIDGMLNGFKQRAETIAAPEPDFLDKLKAARNFRDILLT